MTNVILASQSPRRQELLRLMGVDFETIPSDFEEVLDDNRSPSAVAVELARGKATAVAEKYPDRTVIGSDTIVALDNHQLGKPENEHEARAMLHTLSGRNHQVITAVAVIRLTDQIRLTDFDVATVYFKPYDAPVIERYIKTGDPFDKAAGYGIQHNLATFVDHIEGNYDTVVGLATTKLAELLRQAGVSAKPAGLTPPARLLRV